MIPRVVLYLFLLLAIAQVVVPQKGGGGNRGGGGGNRGGGGGGARPAAPRPAAQAPRPAAQAPRPNTGGNPGGNNSPRPNNPGNNGVRPGGDRGNPGVNNAPRPGNNPGNNGVRPGGDRGNNPGNNAPRPGGDRGINPGNNGARPGGSPNPPAPRPTNFGNGGNPRGNGAGWANQGRPGNGGNPPPYRPDPGWSRNPNRPDWRPYGNAWDRPNYSGPRPWGDYCRGCGAPYATQVVYGPIPTYPAWAAPGWEVNYPWIGRPPRTIYATQWDPVFYGGAPPPWQALPPPILPPITIPAPYPQPPPPAPFPPPPPPADYPPGQAPPPPPPPAQCVWDPVTSQSFTQTQLTYTDTITQPPPDAVITVYLDPDTNEQSTDWGPVETVYEVYVYTTNAAVDIVSSTARCT